SHVTGILRETARTLMNRRMPNGTYGGVRGKETKVGQKTFVSRPTRFFGQKVPSALRRFQAFSLPLSLT
ncbi:MAG: hypothetical protein IJV11_12015, partial [Muribaculaceae bacterium]|nr:hypothetical protein [Muribaculaceae bacterium]